MTPTISAHRESWPIAGEFSIARGRKTSAEIVVAEIAADDACGRGECLPYPRYGESPEQSLAQVAAFAREIARQQEDLEHLTHARLLETMPPCAARNALDCALWDLRAQRANRSVYDLAGLPPPAATLTAYTISLDTPDKMQAAAEASAGRALLKVKLGWSDDDAARLQAVRRGAPMARLIVDVNEGWNLEQLRAVAPTAADLGVEMIEQPLPAREDARLDGYRCPVALGADESLTEDRPLEEIASRYRVVNIKLDKTGGLTRAIAVQQQARALGLDIMIGCMVATSLAIAPALLLAQHARYVDLDGPLLLERDRSPGLVYRESLVSFPPEPFWGNVQGSP